MLRFELSLLSGVIRMKLLFSLLNTCKLTRFHLTYMSPSKMTVWLLVSNSGLYILLYYAPSSSRIYQRTNTANSVDIPIATTPKLIATVVSFEFHSYYSCCSCFACLASDFPLFTSGSCLNCPFSSCYWPGSSCCWLSHSKNFVMGHTAIIMDGIDFVTK